MIYSLLAVGTFFSQYWPVLALLVALIALYIVSIFRRKKDSEQAQKMIDELKPGTKVKTYTGFYGTIDSIRETTDGKVVMLRIGEEGGKQAFVEIDANAIYGIDSKTDVVYDAQGNIIVKEDDSSKTNNKNKEEEQEPEKAPEQQKEKDERVKKPRKSKNETKDAKDFSASDIQPIKEEKKKTRKTKKEEK